MRVKPKEFEIADIVDLGSKIKDSLLPNLVVNAMEVDDIISRIYMGHLPLKAKFNANIGCVMCLKWSQVR